MANKKLSAGSKLNRSQTVTVRLDPKLKYMADLAARKQRRTISSFIEWSIEKALNEISLGDEAENIDHQLPSAAADADELWDVDEAERFMRLAVRYPNLLTHDEQILLKVIADSGLLKVAKITSKGRKDWDHEKLEQIVIPEARAFWKSFQAISNGDEDMSCLPSWTKSGRKYETLQTIASPVTTKENTKSIGEDN